VAGYKDKKLPVHERVEDLLSRMNLREKVGQMNQRLMGFKCYEKRDGEFVPNEIFINELKQFDSIGFLYGLFRADPWSKKTYQNGIAGKDMAKTANKFQRYVIENTRLGIPMIMSSEATHGHQGLDGYTLPVTLAMGCTFNPALIAEGFGVCAKQLRAAGVHMGWVSALDVLREPRWGRSEECPSEDPYLVSRFAAAAVKGFQGGEGKKIGGENVIAVVKHLCGQGESPGGLNAAPAPIGERELREIHLPAMKAASEAGARGCMAAYNEIDGIPCNSNEKLLSEILRGEFGFDGVVIADGGALDLLKYIASTPEECAAAALRAGVDVSLWDSVYPALVKAVEEGLVPESLIDRSVGRILTLKFELGLFENPYVEENPEPDSVTYEDCTQSLELARQSVVLLRNENNLLPFNASEIKKIALIGPNGDDIYNQIGDYSASQKEGNYYTLLDGIKKIAKDAEVLFEKGCDIRSPDTTMIPRAVEAAGKADVVILAVGGSSKRNFDIKFDATGAVIPTGGLTADMDCGEGVDVSDLALGGVQYQLIEEIEKLGKPTVVVSIQGRPLCFSGITSKALICAFYPGPMGGLALAEILFGKCVPSGKLSAGLPSYPYQTHFYYNRKAGVANRKFIDRMPKPLFPFGHGLSYSVFEYSDMNVVNSMISAEEIEKGGMFEVSATVANRGTRDAYETVQLYISACVSPITRRIKELKGFEKVLIKAGDSKTVRFTLGKNELAIWDRGMQFTVPKTKVVLYCGTSSEENLHSEIEIN
jgi:beta-glucosidase